MPRRQSASHSQGSRSAEAAGQDAHAASDPSRFELSVPRKEGDGLTVIEDVQRKLSTAISRMKIGKEDAQILTDFVERRSSSDDSAVLALKVVETVSGVLELAQPYTRAGKRNGRIISTRAMIEIADDLNLQSRELREIADIALKNRRSFERLSEVICSIAGSRTGGDSREIFNGLQPEQRDQVLVTAVRFYNAIECFRESVEEEKVSLKIIEDIYSIVGSIDDIERILIGLSEANINESRFADAPAPHGIYGLILHSIREHLRENGPELFNVQEFLGEDGRTDDFDIYCNEDGAGEPTFTPDNDE